MNAILLKKKRKRSFAITQDGRYVKVKTKKDFFPGQEIEYFERVKRSSRILIPALSAVLILLFAFGVYAYTAPAAYVTLDINPSVELTVNRFDFVINSKALNDDGEVILDEGKLLNRRLKTAIGTLVDNAEGEGYLLSGSEGKVLLTVFSSSEALNEKFTKKLEESKEELENSNKGVGVLVAASNMERKREAEELGISPGKLHLIQKIALEEGTILDPRDYIEMSVKDIVALGKEAKEKAKNEIAAANQNKDKDKDLDAEVDDNDDNSSNEHNDNRDKDKDKDKDKQNNGKNK